MSNEEAVEKAGVFLICVFALAGFAFGLLTKAVAALILQPQPQQQIRSTLFFIIIGVIILWKPTKKNFWDFTNRFSGIVGEYKVSVILNDLYREGFRSVDNVVLIEEKGNIDHVVVSSSGLWAVETKTRSGRHEVTRANCNAISNGGIRQAHAQAYALRDFLKEHGFGNLPVRPMLVFASKYTKVSVGEEPVDGVQVIGAAWLRKTILSQTPTNIITPADVEKITDLLKTKQAEF